MTAFPPGAVTEWRYVGPDLDEKIEGIRAVELARLTGLSYRQVDYWIRTGRLTASIDANGSGTQRLFDADDYRLADDLAHLTAAGIPIGLAHHIALQLRADRVVPVTDRLYLVRVP